MGVPLNKRVKDEPDNEWVSTVHTTVSKWSDGEGYDPPRCTWICGFG